MAFLSPSQLAQLGLAAVGSNVLISDRASLHGAGAISIGDHVRIDDFVIITARQPVILGSYVHIAAFAFLAGQFGLVLGDFVGISPRATLLSGNDDYTGHWLPGPLIPPELRQVRGSCLTFGNHALVGAHSVVLPGASFADGAALGALSLVKEPLEPWSIYVGIPARRRGPRSRHCEELAARLPRPR